MKLVECSCTKTVLVTGTLNEFYGLHVRSDLKVSDIATNRERFAGTCEVKLTFKGKGHAAFS